MLLKEWYLVPAPPTSNQPRDIGFELTTDVVFNSAHPNWKDKKGFKKETLAGDKVRVAVLTGAAESPYLQTQGYPYVKSSWMAVSRR